MKSILSHPYFSLVSRVILGLTFVFAAVEKISYPEEFAVAIQAYQIVPMQYINIIALILPWLELVCGVLLWWGQDRGRAP